MANIHSLIERGDTKGVVGLLQQNAAVANGARSPDEPDQPVHIAAWQNRLKIIGLLLEKGADINAIGDSGFVPLHYVAREGHIKATRLLLAAGANPDITNDFGFTPLLTAVRGREPSCLKVAALLRQAGARADLNSLISLGETETICQMLHYNPTSINESIDKNSLLDEAIIMVASQLITAEQQKAEAEKVNHYRPLFLCLLKAGADINAIGSTGYPALFTAIQTNIVPLVRLLLENGANVNYRLVQWGKSTDALSLTSGTEGREMRQLLYEFGFKR